MITILILSLTRRSAATVVSSQSEIRIVLAREVFVVVLHTRICIYYDKHRTVRVRQLIVDASLSLGPVFLFHQRYVTTSRFVFIVRLICAQLFARLVSHNIIITHGHDIHVKIRNVDTSR